MKKMILLSLFLSLVTMQISSQSVSEFETKVFKALTSLNITDLDQVIIEYNSFPEKENLTPLLSIAVYTGDESVVRRLIELGVPANLDEASKGIPPIFAAVSNNAAGMVKILLENGASKRTISPLTSKPILEFAREFSTEEIVKMLQ